MNRIHGLYKSPLKEANETKEFNAIVVTTKNNRYKWEEITHLYNQINIHKEKTK
jgi:hypothetical protein